MKDAFRGYYTPTPEEFAELWKTCIFALDANVLLNLYRYSAATRESFVQVLLELSKVSRVWIPHQAALEYHRRRIDVIKAEIAKYGEVLKQLQALADALDSRSHPFVDEPLVEQFRVLRGQIEESINERSAALSLLYGTDHVRDTITEIFDQQVGPSYEPQRLAEIEKEGKARYESRVPPGFKDGGKEGPAKYGDLVLWFQAIDKAKEVKKPIIFITDDGKEDWWLQRGDTTFGPRPELIEEMYREAGVAYHMYDSEQFLKLSVEYSTIDIPESVVEEVQTVSEEDQDARKAIRIMLEEADGIGMPQEELAPTRRLLEQLSREPEGLRRFREAAEASHRRYESIPGGPEGLRRLSEQAEAARRMYESAFGGSEGFRRVQEQAAASYLAYESVFGGPGGFRKFREQTRIAQRLAGRLPRAGVAPRAATEARPADQPPGRPGPEEPEVEPTADA